MAKGTQFDLSLFTQQADGSYKKKSTSVQPRDINRRETTLTADPNCPPERDYSQKFKISSVDDFLNTPVPSIKIDTPKTLRKITLNLFGEPMPKQSVRSYADGSCRTGKEGKKAYNTFHYQPAKMIDRSKDYIRQIKEQLPKDFTPFMEQVFVTKFHCVYSPLKSFHKVKGKMNAIRNGEMFYKNTQPDLIDNLKKLIFDCLGKDKKTKIPLVLGNDGIIVGEDNTRKYYGIGGCIIIDLEGY